MKKIDVSCISKDDVDALFTLPEPPPTPENILTCLVAKDDDGIIVFGFIKLFAEAIIIPDRTRGKLETARAIKLLTEAGANICRTAKIEELHAFVEESQWADLLREHLGFSNVKGEALSLRVEGEQQTSRTNDSAN